MLDNKRRLYLKYRAALKGIKGIRLLDEPMGCKSNFWLQTLILDQEYSVFRDRILEATNNAGLMTRPVWTTMHNLVAFRDCPRMSLNSAESLEGRIINLPSSAILGLGAL